MCPLRRCNDLKHVPLSGPKDHLQTLKAAQAQPHARDDAAMGRGMRVHPQQLEFADIHDRQLQHWQAEKPSTAQNRELDCL